MHVLPKHLNFIKTPLAHYGDLHPSKGTLWHPIQTWFQNTRKYSEQGLRLKVSFSFHFFHSHQAHSKLRMSKATKQCGRRVTTFFKALLS
jgi:hypothetical protein